MIEARRRERLRGRDIADASPSYLLAEGSCDAARRRERVPPQRWQFRSGRPNRSARVFSRLLGIAFATGIGPSQAATIEVRGRKTGRKISFPVVVVAYQGERYLVAMLGDRTNWVRNLRADNHAVLLRGKRQNVSIVEDFSDKRAAILRRYLEVGAGARPFFPIDRRAPLSEFERIVDEYPVFRVVAPV
jgi:hypothetical protein